MAQASHGGSPTADNAGDNTGQTWLHAKLAAYPAAAEPAVRAALERAVTDCDTPETPPLFDNPFAINDLLVFDAATLREMLAASAQLCDGTLLAHATSGATPALVRVVRAALPRAERARFIRARRHPVASATIAAAQRTVLDALFWELTYWKTPDLYEMLTEGEQIHPGIFQRLAPALRGSVVLDAGAGSGRATFACLRQGARHVHAIEPSPGLLRLLEGKIAAQGVAGQVTPRQGRFEALPLADDSVDVALSCSAFTTAPEQGGEPGLAELRRVTRSGGLIVIIWPRPQDYTWLAQHGFQYVALASPRTLGVRFRSLQSALQVAQRFYARNSAVLRYLRRQRQRVVPFALLGANPPHDYCWLRVD